MSWRVTYSKGLREDHPAVDERTGVVSPQTPLRASAPMELRESDGTIVRLDTGAEFEIKESPLGKRPEYYGPVFISRKGGCGKYRTSCWVGVYHQPRQRPDVFIRPGHKPEVDEFYAITGDIIIYEFDEEARTFIICTVHEGEKALVSFDPKAQKAKERYTAQVVPFTDSEYEYVLTRFIDRRNWA